MAKNKREINRELKEAEIEIAAGELFLQYGYEFTSMAMIAAHAEVAPNTLYWYYKNKDDVLVAALNRIVIQVMAQLHAQQEKTIVEQLAWVTDYFVSSKNLISTVHARLEQSTVIRDWHHRFHQMLDAMLLSQLTQYHIPVAEAKIITTIVTFTIEGLLSHQHSPQQRTQILQWLTEVILSKKMQPVSGKLS